ncbi:MAG: Fis family transcriptional regulator [Chromatiales bacterium 21-64-14]|nr:MAG: Fis family transcriptional regulator [Chromatiales bacterium 21-64-14]HQU15345.1 sigma 54-interacting transcriptional regulator [Gammaproteobacteria bacterium]
MSDFEQRKLTPITFLQTFVTQSVKIAAQLGNKGTGDASHIEHLGIAASSCLEDTCRRQMGVHGDISRDQYANMIVRIKNQIGGNFSRASSEPGVVRVVNTRCPFGDAVKEAPELCRMTSSVFGGIAARNFGYAKVELRKRIATNDGCCEVCVYTDPEQAVDKPGDEYRSEGNTITAKSTTVDIVVRVEEKMRKAWCHAASKERPPENARHLIVAASEVMRAALERVDIVAPTPATVLVTGETGVGKEVIARAVHAMSGRWNQPFVAVNCGAIPENLIESMLFGHERGAFTGAYEVHHGFFERAERGTLFLDEIDSLPLAAQPRLLRVLQDNEFERVGGKQTLKAEVRIIAASNQNIEELVASGKFRRDLYYRLNVVPIHIPPLREQKEALPALVRHFLDLLAEKYDGQRKMLGELAWGHVMAYDWPGNVRELENAMERAFLFAPGDVIEDVGIKVAPARISVDGIRDTDASIKDLKRNAARQLESRLIREALERCDGNVTAVARMMEITPRAVHQKLVIHGINPNTYRVRMRPAGTASGA